MNQNADLVERCKSEVGDLSARVAVQLPADLEKRTTATETQILSTEPTIDAFAALYAAHGSLSEEVQSL